MPNASPYSIAFLNELLERSAESALAGDRAEAWKLLSWAHILSQPFARLHVYVHWRMLLLAFTESNGREILGQALRLLVAAPGSWTGKFPLGNSGLSNVSMFQPMQVPEELSRKMSELREVSLKE